MNDTPWSNRISYARPHRDVRVKLLEQLQQDGLNENEIFVPELGSEDFYRLIQDAEAFSNELGATDGACPIRAGRWLNRVALTITKKSYLELPLARREAIAHAAIMLGGKPELLR